MNILFHTDSIRYMADWLLEYKRSGIRDEQKLREILSHPDYSVEFERYSAPGLPVCGISKEEAIRFFMNFDCCDFDNPRLQSKKASFLSFFNELEARLKTIEAFTSLSDEDICTMEALLKNGLPDEAVCETTELHIILIISIGNSMGWPYGHFIDYDISNLDAFKTKADFIHVTAHEIHHMFLGGLLNTEGITGGEAFLLSFAFEGLAVHFNNNLRTKMKPSKYADSVYGMQDDDMTFYEEHFDEIFDMIRTDYRACQSKSVQEAIELLSDKYEQFEFLGRPVKQYPTYYFGCYMWGLLDMNFGKAALFSAINNPLHFVELYNQAAAEGYRL